MKELRNSIGTRHYPGTLQQKQLERIIGCLNHIAIAYEITLPFLRGFHNTIDRFQYDRDVKGWKDLDQSSKWLEITHHLLLNKKISKGFYDQLRSSQK